jgi:ribose transport system substrate-binding protein
VSSRRAGLWKRAGCGIAMAAVATALAACGSSGGSDATAANGKGKPDPGKHVRVALFVAIQANPVEQVIIDTAKKTAAANNASVTVFDSNNDIQREVTNCQDAIASNQYDIFILKAVSGPPLVPCAHQAMAAGIPVVVEGTALGPKQTAQPQVPGIIGSSVTLSTTNGVAVADLADHACQKLSASPCKVAYLFGPVAFDYASITRQVFLQTVKAKYPNINVVAQQSTNWVPDTGAQQARQLLQLHPDLNAIITDSDPVAAAIEQVIAQAGKTGKVLVTGAAGSKAGVAAIKAGKQFGDTVVLPASEARTAMMMALRAARHESVGQTAIDATKDLSPVGTYVDAKNVAKFRPEW